jgi:hypothetical protein
VEPPARSLQKAIAWSSMMSAAKDTAINSKSELIQEQSLAVLEFMMKIEKFIIKQSNEYKLEL